MTSILSNIQFSPETAYMSTKDKLLWLASHPIVLIILVVVFIILALLYTVLQNSIDGASAKMVVGLAFCAGLFIIVFVFFLGLKAGHYPRLENWIASAFHISAENMTAAANTTMNQTG